MNQSIMHTGGGHQSPTEVEEMATRCLTGERLYRASDTTLPGPGTYMDGDYICAKEAGILVTSRTSKNLRMICVEATQEEDVRKNQVKKSRPKRFHCQDCGLFFSTEEQLTTHTHDSCPKDQNVNRNTNCNETFTQPETLDRHKLKDKGLKPYACGECGKRFGLRFGLNNHILDVHGTSQHQVTRLENLVVKKKTKKSTALPFVCGIKNCKRRFSTNRGLARHKAAHKPSRIYTCFTCVKRYKSLVRFKDHLKRKHSKKKEKSANKCSDLERPFACDLCSSRFTIRHHLERHKLIHTGIKPHSCVICEKSFTRKDSLKEHILTVHCGKNRAKERIHKYFCEFPGCNQGFTQQNALYRHKLIHTDKKNHSCSFCGKSFGRSDELKYHYSIHEKRWRVQVGSRTLAWPFACTHDACSETFERYKDFTKHILAHEDNGTFSTSDDQQPDPVDELKEIYPQRGHKLDNKELARKYRRADPEEYISDSNNCNRIVEYDMLPSKDITPNNTTVDNDEHSASVDENHESNYRDLDRKELAKRYRRSASLECVCTLNGCNKIFSSRQNLLRHQLLHTGAKPHACLFCDKRFGRKDKLLTHMRLHKPSKLHQTLFRSGRSATCNTSILKAPEALKSQTNNSINRTTGSEDSHANSLANPTDFTPSSQTIKLEDTAKQIYKSNQLTTESTSFTSQLQLAAKTEIRNQISGASQAPLATTEVNTCTRSDLMDFSPVSVNNIQLMRDTDRTNCFDLTKKSD